MTKRQLMDDIKRFLWDRDGDNYVYNDADCCEAIGQLVMDEESKMKGHEQ